jgi:hypothetical protein
MVKWTIFSVSFGMPLKSSMSQSCFNKVGHLLVCKQSKRGQEPKFLIHTL